MRTVCVLLSSYNGEQFIKEQIDSILAQQGVKVRLIVRDDGSTDSTVSILEGYSKKGLLAYYQGANIGWKNSFFDLMLNAPEFEYYAFSDQDDYWLPSKLENALKGLDNLVDGPNLYVSNTLYWRGEFKRELRTKYPRLNKERCLIWSLGPGCTMVFNHKLINLIKVAPPHIETPHDKRVQQVAALLGHIYYDMKPYIYYRQHDNNQLGATISFMENFKRRFRYYFSFKENNILEDETTDLLICYGDLMTSECVKMCDILVKYKRELLSYLGVLFSMKFLHENLMTSLGFKWKVMLRRL